MDREYEDTPKIKKSLRATEREWSAALFLLRAVQLGLSMADLDMLTCGTVMDMFTELSNDSCEYNHLATAEDIAGF